MLLDKIRKLLGYHACEEFTRWQTRKRNYMRPVTDPVQAIVMQKTEIEYTRRWQERVCTICGKIEQRELQ